MKKRHKRAGAIILAVALMAGMVSPLSVFAEETVNGQAAIQEEVKIGESVGTETVESAGAEGNGTPERVKESASKESSETAESESGESKEGSETAESESGESKESSTAVQSETGSVEESKDTGKADESFDTTAPVIEKVTLEQNGQTLKLGDTVKVLIEAYDTGSGIAEVTAELYLTAEGERWPQPEKMQVVHKEGNLYEATYQLPEDTGYTEGWISKIIVKDKVSHTTEAKIDENGSYLYKFTIEPAEQKVYVVSDFQFEGQGKTYTEGDTLELSYVLEGQDEVYKGRDMYVDFKVPDGLTTSFPAHYNFETGRYEVSEAIYVKTTWEGKWQLDSIFSSWGGPTICHDISNIGSVWFNVEDSEETGGEGEEDDDKDKESPVITSVELSHNGEFAEPGTSLMLTIKAEDNVGLDKNYAYVRFKAAADNIENDEISVPLSYDEAKDAFVGTFEVTEETYPCEWTLFGISIKDMAGNYWTSAERINYNDYYVLVKNGDTFVNPDVNVTVTFDALDEAGKRVQISEVKKTVPRRTTLKEAGIEIPTPPATVQGINFKGWVEVDSKSRKPLDENKLLLRDESIDYEATYDNIPVSVSYEYLNKDGRWVNAFDKKTFPENTTLREVYESFAGYSVSAESPAGFTFKGWGGVTGYLDMPVGIGKTLFINAEYNEGVGDFSYSYMDVDNNWKTVEKKVPFDKAATREAVIEKAKQHHEADETKDLKFIGWQENHWTQSELGNDMAIEFIAMYEDGKVVTSKAYYNDESGRDAVAAEKSYIVKEGTTYGEIRQKIEDDLAANKPKMHSDLRFKDWKALLTEQDDAIIDKNHCEIIYEAQYENCIDRFYVYDLRNISSLKIYEDPYGTKADAFTYVISEKGETFTFPTKIENYTNLDSFNYSAMIPGKEYAAHGSIYQMTGDKIGTEPENPTEPDKPTEPENPTEPDKPTKPENPTEPQNPAIELPQDFIDQQVDKLNKGESVHIQMGDATVVPKEMLMAAKGKDVNIILDMGGYTWTINGKDIIAGSLQDINLEVKVNSNAIPDSTVKALAGDNPTCQLSLTHNGPFGFKASLTVNVGSQYEGKFGNLYYHDSAGKMIYRNAGKVDANGNVTLSFDHASDYVIVLADKQMSQPDVPSGLQPGAPNQGNGPVKTGDATPILMFAVLAILSAAVVMVIFMVKRKKV